MGEKSLASGGIFNAASRFSRHADGELSEDSNARPRHWQILAKLAGVFTVEPLTPLHSIGLVSRG
jgi:hypothetical protein